MNILSHRENQFLVLSLLTIVLFFIIGNFIEQENFPISEDIYFTDILFVIIPVIVIILGIVLCTIYRGRGTYGKAWIIFTISIIVWYVGETTFDYEYDYDIEDISTLTSDIFYIIGYPIFFVFTLLYLKPRKNAITKNMILVGLITSILFVLPTLYFTFEGEEELDSLTVFLYAIYPILDALVLGPAIVAMFLFFRGQVSFLWTLILFATLSDILADTLFLFFAVEESYYPGHPVDILYLFSYTLYAFGVYSHIKLYKNPAKEL